MDSSRSPAFGGQSKTSRTEQAYIRRAEFLLSRCRKQLSLDSDPDPMGWAGWLVSQRPALAKSSWRQYKAAATHYLQSMGTEAAMEAVAFLSSKNSSVCLKKSTRTSAMRMKNIKEEEFFAFVDHIKGVNSWYRKYAGVLHTWLVLGNLTGLRPHEWCQASLVERIENPDDLAGGTASEPSVISNGGRLYLRVKNSKHTNGRAHGTYRHLDLSDFDDSIISAIRSLIRFLGPDEDAPRYRDTYEGCKRLLADVNKDFFRASSESKRIHLYSARHRYSATLKNIKLPEEVAAAMGHGSDQTAYSMYGRSNYSGKGVVAHPVEEEVSRVRRVKRTPAFLMDADLDGPVG